MPRTDDGETDFENTGADIGVLKEPDAKLDEKLLYLIGRVAILQELLEEDVPLGPTTVKRLHRLKTLVADLPVPAVFSSRKLGFGA